MNRKWNANAHLARLAWVIIMGITLWLMLFAFTGERFTPVRMASYLAPWMAALLLITVAGTIAHRRRLAITSLLLTVVVGYPYLGLLVPLRGAPASEAAGYKVMTYSKMGRNHDIAAVSRVVRSQRPDLLFMQEIGEGESAALIDQLGDLYNGQPIHALADNHYGLILSRFPLHSRLKTGDSALHAEVTFPGSSVSVWNLHLPKSMASTQAEYDAVEQLVGQLIRQPGPTIVAGDLNATQINHPYLAIAQHLDNAFEKAGFGMGFTFPSPARRMGWITPFMRIDHIFVSGHFQIHDVYVVDEAGGSDHYPVVAVVGMDNAILQSQENDLSASGGGVDSAPSVRLFAPPSDDRVRPSGGDNAHGPAVGLDGVASRVTSHTH